MQRRRYGQEEGKCLKRHFIYSRAADLIFTFCWSKICVYEATRFVGMNIVLLIFN